MGVSFSGLGSGLDTASIIAQLMRLERAPVQRIEQRKQETGAQRGVVSDVVAKMKTLQDKARALDTLGEVRTYQAKSDDEAVLVATASGSASPGTYDITVNQLAKTERTWSGAFASKTDTGLVGTGDLKITVGTDSPVTVSIDQSTDSLESVAAKINASGARVDASIVYDGSAYHLVVAGREPGAANAIAFDDPTSLDLDVAGNEKQAAQDSEIVMDGQTIHRPTNVLTDVLEGVTLRLKKPSDQPVGLTIDVDPEGMRGKVQAFVDAYNDLASLVGKQFVFDPKAARPPLAGDGTLRDQFGRLQRIVTSEVRGLGGRYTALSEVGVSTNRDGTLKLDGAAFDAAAADDALGVAKLFTREDNSTGVAAQIDDEVKAATDFETGRMTLRSKSLGERIAQSDKDITRLEAQAEKTQQRLQAQFAALEQLVSGLHEQGDFLQGLLR